MVWRQLIRLFLRAVTGLLWISAGLLVKQARRVEALAQALLEGTQPAASAPSPPAHWLADARSPGPPAHWVERVRQGAPHLLSAAPGRERAPRSPASTGTPPAVRQTSEVSRTTTPPAAEPPLRMRIRVLDARQPPPPLRRSTRGSLEEKQPGATHAGAAAKPREESQSARPVAETTQSPPPVAAPPKTMRAPATPGQFPARRRQKPETRQGPAPATAATPAEQGSFRPVAAPRMHTQRANVPLAAKRQPPVAESAETHFQSEEDISSRPALPPERHRRILPAEGHHTTLHPPEEEPVAPSSDPPERPARTDPHPGTSLAARERPGVAQGESHPQAAEADRWPSLPSSETPVSPSAEAILRMWQHRRRLDDEQRGSTWNG